MTDDSIAEINTAAGALEEKIRAYCRGQKELWRRVPYLALQADGRDGYSSHFRTAYTHGFWGLENNWKEGCYYAYVDLATGEIVSRPGHDGNLTPAGREHVLDLAEDLEEIDAASIVDMLADEVPNNRHRKQTEQDIWRSRMAEDYNVERLYTRKK